ncbi:MAG TPA: hypothetical protein PLW02_01135 [Verrucomicrobiota bacterium]|nr:hypothetical protein [Verrucomicrobiota bacterium]
MKNKIISVVILTSALTLASSAYSQDNKPQNAPAGPVNMMTISPETMISNRVNALSRSLNLTDEQKQKVKPIVEDEFKKYQELRTQKNLSPQERAAKMREIREASSQKMKEILTEEQWKKYYRPMTNAPALRPAAPAQGDKQPAPAAPATK